MTTDAAIDRRARETSFSGVVHVERDGETRFLEAYGFADRAHGIPNTVGTRFALASGAKGFTALTVVRAIQDGALSFDTTARSLLGDDLPLIADDVTVEHLLAHRSGIGDYFDEEAFDDVTAYVLPVPVHVLDATVSYLRVLDGYPMVTTPGERFRYCNGGYVVLALLVERATDTPFHALVRRTVCDPAGMPDTGYLRSDELPGEAALNYLSGEGLRTNVHHLPVLGSGDGGISSTAIDVAALWRALFAGAIVAPALVDEMVRPRSVSEDGSRRYGLGFWLDATSDVVWLEGHDAGVSFISMHDPVTVTTATAIANTSEGAWPFVELLEATLEA